MGIYDLIMIGKFGKSGSSSDWNASEGQPGHILNRPFYEETKWEELLPLTLVTGFTDKGIAELPVFEIVGGDKYRVHYNGVEYELTAKNIYGGADLAVGGAMVGDWANVDYPFGITYFIPNEDDEAATTLHVVAGVTEATVSVSHGSVEVKKIDPKFLPDSIGG